MTPPTQADDHVFLNGRPPIGEFVGFIRTMSLDGQAVDQGKLADEWRQANDHVIELEKTEAGIADGAAFSPLPEAVKPLAKQVRNEPSFQSNFRMIPTEFGVVELDRLIVCQKFINLGFVGMIKSTFPQNPTEVDVAQLAFGLNRPSPAVQQMQMGNTFTFLSSSNDFRVLDTTVLQPQQVLAPRNGRPVAHVAIAIGFSSNLLNVASIEGRLVLHNGSHRAYFLRDIGITHAACVIQRVTRRDELEFLGGEVHLNPDRYLKAPRPPLLKDYFDPKLRKVIAVPKKNRSVRVQFGCEQIDVPA
jgi:hypothetical protein